MSGESLRMVSELGPRQAEQLVALFGREWWTKDRDLEGVNRMLEGSTEIVGVLDGDDLIAFGRAVSDGVYRASINDVVVAEGRRGEGHGVAVIRELLSRPMVASSGHVDLHCLEDMVPFYESFGFKPGPTDQIRMIIVDRGT